MSWCHLCVECMLRTKHPHSYLWLRTPFPRITFPYGSRSELTRRNSCGLGSQKPVPSGGWDGQAWGETEICLDGPHGCPTPLPASSSYSHELCWSTVAPTWPQLYLVKMTHPTRTIAFTVTAISTSLPGSTSFAVPHQQSGTHSISDFPASPRCLPMPVLQANMSDYFFEALTLLPDLHFLHSTIM